LGKLSGEVVVDATSGESGKGMRARKMHREVLESDRYPEIAVHPDRFEGGRIIATQHFTSQVPYAKWGMKNPGTFFLRVSESVDIDVITVGTTGRR
jgi:hypothetical protein